MSPTALPTQEQLLARMAAKLGEIREGNGALLDHTLIVYLSDSDEAHHSNLRVWPVVLIGGMGGKLKLDGRYVQLPYYNAKQHRRLANRYLALLAAAGQLRDKLGIPDNGLRDIDQSGDILELHA